MFPAKGGDVHGLSYAVLVVQTRGGKSGRGQSCKSPPHGNVPRELVLPPGTHVEMGQTEGLVVIPGEPSVGTAWGQWQPLQLGGSKSRASRPLPSLPAALPSFPAAPHLLCHPPGDAGSTTAVPCSLLHWHKPLRQAPSTPSWSTVPVTAPFRGIWRLTAPAARTAPTRRLHRLIPRSWCVSSLVPGLLHPLPERLTFVNLPSAPRWSSLVRQNRQVHAEALPHFSFYNSRIWRSRTQAASNAGDGKIPWYFYASLYLEPSGERFLPVCGHGLPDGGRCLLPFLPFTCCSLRGAGPRPWAEPSRPVAASIFSSPSPFCLHPGSS